MPPPTQRTPTAAVRSTHVRRCRWSVVAAMVAAVTAVAAAEVVWVAEVAEAAEAVALLPLPLLLLSPLLLSLPLPLLLSLLLLPTACAAVMPAGAEHNVVERAEQDGTRPGVTQELARQPCHASEPRVHDPCSAPEVSCRLMVDASTRSRARVRCRSGTAAAVAGARTAAWWHGKALVRVRAPCGSCMS